MWKLGYALAISMVALAAAAAVACGNDDDTVFPFTGQTPAKTTNAASSPASATPTAIPAGNDRDFARAVCTAAGHFSDKVAEVFAEASPEDIANNVQGISQAIAPALASFRDAVGRVRPPRDLVQWQKDAVSELDGLVRELRSGTPVFDAHMNLRAGALPALPPGARDRLDRLSRGEPECNAVNPFVS